MIRVHTCLPLPIPAADVWQRIGGFSALADWHPGVLSSPLLPGNPARRRVTLADGAEIIEHCTARDEAARSYHYTLVSGPLPVQDYSAALTVRETGVFDCRVDWSAGFRPQAGADGAALADRLCGVFSAGLCGAAAFLRR